MQKTKIRVRKKGQITLPQDLRARWEVSEGSELALIEEGDHAIIRPVRRTRIKEEAGSLGRSDKDEIDFATMDSELVSEYYSRKYRH